MKSKIFLSKMKNSTLPEGTWIPVLLGIAFFFAYPVTALIQMGYWTIEYQPEQIQFLCDRFLRLNFIEFGSLCILLAALFHALHGFGYLYSKEKVDFYHCLPISRTHMYLQKLLHGLCNTILPYMLSVFLCLMIFGIRGYFHMGMLLLVLRAFAKHILLYLFLYFCFVLLLTMTGNILMGVLSAAGFALYGPMLSLLLSGYCDEFFNNYSGIDNGFIYEILNFTPISVFASLAQFMDEGDLISLPVILMWTLLMGLFSYLAFVRRPSEATGKAIVYDWFALLLKFAMVIPCGLASGLLMASLAVEHNLAWGLFGVLFGTILVKCLMEVLYTFDFRSAFTHKLQLPISFAAILGIVCIFRFDLFGYDTYIPKYEKIQSINTDLSDVLNRYSPTLVMDENGYYSDSSALYSDQTALCMNENELGGDVYRILTKIAKGSDDTQNERFYRSIRIRYNLKSGGKKYRDYVLSQKEYRQLFEALYQETNFREIIFSGLDLDADYLFQIYGTFADGQSYSLFPNMHEKQAELLKALKADYEDMQAETLLNDYPVVSLNLDFQNIPYEPNPDYPFQEDPVMAFTDTIYVYPSFTRTIRLLRETGYTLDFEDVKEDQISILLHTYNETEDRFIAYGPFVFDDKEQAAEIKENMVFFRNDLFSVQDDIEVRISKEDSSDKVISYCFPVDRIPDFVQELYDKALAGELEENLYDTDEPAAVG